MPSCPWCFKCHSAVDIIEWVIFLQPKRDIGHREKYSKHISSLDANFNIYFLPFLLTRDMYLTLSDAKSWSLRTEKCIISLTLHGFKKVLNEEIVSYLQDPHVSIYHMNRMANYLTYNALWPLAEYVNHVTIATDLYFGFPFFCKFFPISRGNSWQIECG